MNRKTMEEKEEKCTHQCIFFTDNHDVQRKAYSDWVGGQGGEKANRKTGFVWVEWGPGSMKGQVHS